jgi:hypothetical protein
MQDVKTYLSTAPVLATLWFRFKPFNHSIQPTTPLGANWNAGCPQNLPWFVLKMPKDFIFNESQLKVVPVSPYLLAF